MVQLAGATIRNVSRGVIGISFLQAFLAGAGFLAAGIPAASVLAFVTLLLGIIQIGPTILFIPIVVWSWLVMEPGHALMFTAYMVPGLFFGPIVLSVAWAVMKALVQGDVTREPRS